MHRVFIDTNVLLDVFLERQPFFDSSYAVLELCSYKKIEGFITSSNVKDIYYFLKKYNHSNEETRDIVRTVISILDVSTISIAEILLALDIPNSDFEDMVSYISCVDVHADYIITRNVKDFNNQNKITVITPEEFILNYKLNIN